MVTMKLRVRWSVVWGRMDTAALKVGRRVVSGVDRSEKAYISRSLALGLGLQDYPQ